MVVIRSARATITSTSFVNEYHWGSLKGDPADWMRRYFDAFIYVANWRSCRLALRVPRSVFNKAELMQYVTEVDALAVDAAGSHWIIDWSFNESDDYERFDMEDGRGWMGRLVPLRDELLHGDLRPLYLGWLSGVASGEVDDDAVEPEVPPGMSQLSAPQQALAEFLEIDPDLLVAAAAGSPVIAESSPDGNAGIDAWLAQQSADEMRVALKMLLQGQSQQAERQIKSRFLGWQKEQAQSAASRRTQRRVNELWKIAAEAEKHRLQREAEERARQDALEQKKREAYLAMLAVLRRQRNRDEADDTQYEETARAIWADAGVLVNELARPALFLNLPVAGAVLAYGKPGYLSLRELLRAPPHWDVAQRTVYVCENPNLVAIAADALGECCAPLACTDGMPAAAQRTLLAQLAAAGAHLCYHGDFDWPGLRIGNWVMRQFNAQPWRYRAQDYLAAAADADGRRRAVGTDRCHADWNAALAVAMQACGRAIDEEAIADVLLADLAVGRDSP